GVDVFPIGRDQPYRILLRAADTDRLEIAERRRKRRPPFLVMRPHLLYYLGMLLGHVGVLPRVGLQIVKFLAEDQPPFVPHYAGIPLLGNLAVLHDDHAVGYGLLGSREQAGKAGAVEPGTGRLFETA